MTRTAQLIEIAKELAQARNGFADALGPGAGNHRTNSFTAELRERAACALGADFSECRFCDDLSSRFDFYFRDEFTVVEVALGLPNPNTEFEKDILKALVAREFEHPVERLVFISRNGAKKKCQQPGRAAIIEWARKRHGLRIEIIELGGAARKR